jgi:hypothetical protein
MAMRNLEVIQFGGFVHNLGRRARVTARRADL